MKKWFMGLFLLLCGCRETIHTAFLSPVCIKPFKRYTYHTCKTITFEINHDLFTIPKNFDTDLASIPRILWPILSPAHSSLMRASIVHDYLYRKPCKFTRLEVDKIFYHMLKNDKVPYWRYTSMYYVVRLLGWRFYGRKFLYDNGRSDYTTETR